MDTRIVKVVRTLTLTTTVTMEIPVTLTNSELEDAIDDQGEVFSLIDESLYDMYEEEDQTEVIDYIPSEDKVSKEFPFAGELEEALKNDELI